MIPEGPEACVLLVSSLPPDQSRAGAALTEAGGEEGVGGRVHPWGLTLEMKGEHRLLERLMAEILVRVRQWAPAVNK